MSEPHEHQTQVAPPQQAIVEDQGGKPEPGFLGKRLWFRCNRWIRPGQRIRTKGGSEATIIRLDGEGVTYGDDGAHGRWAVTRPWYCVFGRSHDRMLNFVEAWGPVKSNRHGRGGSK